MNPTSWALLSSPALTHSKGIRTLQCLVASFLLLLATLSSAQASESPPRPQTWVQDNSRIFKSEDISPLENRLADFVNQTGIEIFVVTVPFSSKGAIGAEARQLISAWEEQRPALIIAFSRGEDACFIYPGSALTRIYPADIVFTSFHSLNATANEMAAPPSERITFLVNSVVKEFQVIHQNFVTQTAKEASALQKLKWIGFIVLLLGCLGMHLLAQKLTPILVECMQKTELPRVHMPSRLGAPFGGGKIASSPTSHPKS